MSTATLPAGTVHDSVPDDLVAALEADPDAMAAWLDITPLARNEWICLVTDAKQAKTRVRRLERTIDQLGGGHSRPCCWPGCPHRERNGH